MSYEELSTVGKRAWQSSALVSPRKTQSRDVAPIGDDIERVGESGADVEMGNEEDEEALDAEIPRVRMNPKNPTSTEKMEHDEMLSTGVGVLLVSKIEELMDNIELNCWRKRNEKERLRS